MRLRARGSADSKGDASQAGGRGGTVGVGGGVGMGGRIITLADPLDWMKTPLPERWRLMDKTVDYKW